MSSSSFKLIDAWSICQILRVCIHFKNNINVNISATSPVYKTPQNFWTTKTKTKQKSGRNNGSKLAEGYGEVS